MGRPGTSVLDRPRSAPAAPPPATLVSRRVRRRRRNLGVLLAVVVVALGLWVGLSGGGGKAAAPPSRPRPAGRHRGPGPMDPDWTGDGRAVTLAFGGDVHFPSGTTLGDRLAADPSTALGPTVPQLLAGADLSMVNLESAMTSDGSCPEPQPKQYVFSAPATALDAFKGAGVTLITETNNHGEDCGPPGLQQALQARATAHYPVLGMGQNEDQAFAPYRATVHGQRIVIIAATQVIDSDLQTAWTATAHQPGLASAYQVDRLVQEVEAARRTADTVVVYLHWGTEQDACPNPLQEPLATLLVRAGADVIVGTHAHVLLGGGYLGSAYVDYGLGNFAFYDNDPPENQSGALVVTVTGRRVDHVTWRPAVIQDDLPQPLSGAAATAAQAAWVGARSCTDVHAAPGRPLATGASESAAPTPAQVHRLSVDGG